LDSEDDDILDHQDNIVWASILMEATMTAGSKEMENAGSAETAIQCTFYPDNMLNRVLLPNYVKAGIPDLRSRMTLPKSKMFSEGSSLNSTIVRAQVFTSQITTTLQKINQLKGKESKQKMKSKFAAMIAQGEIH
jgi:hypothetical protein